MQAGLSAITVLADRAFPSAELLGWFEGSSRWRYVMRLRADTWVHSSTAPMGCELCRLRLPRGHCRGFRDVQLWDGGRWANWFLARPVGITVSEPWYLVSKLDPGLELVWAYGQHFCCELLFRDQKSGIFQFERSGLRDPARIDRLLLVVAIAVFSGLQGCAISLAGELPRRSPLKTRAELCPYRFALAAAERDNSRACPFGLDADPAAGAGAVCSQPRCQAAAEKALVLTD